MDSWYVSVDVSALVTLLHPLTLFLSPWRFCLGLSMCPPLQTHLTYLVPLGLQHLDEVSHHES